MAHVFLKLIVFFFFLFLCTNRSGSTGCSLPSFIPYMLLTHREWCLYSVLSLMIQLLLWSTPSLVQLISTFCIRVLFLQRDGIPTSFKMWLYLVSVLIIINLLHPALWNNPHHSFLGSNPGEETCTNRVHASLFWMYVPHSLCFLPHCKPLGIVSAVLSLHKARSSQTRAPR